MRVISVAGAVGAICLMAVPAWSQDADDVAQLRQQVKLLQGKLQEIEAGRKSERVTEIGGTRPRGREPELVVRIYDLSDLFTMAPPYEAKFSGDLKEEDRAIFPRPAIDRVGPGGAGGMGGLNMGGMGGGMFSVKEKEGEAVLPDKSKQALLQQLSGVKAGAGRASIDDLIETITSTINPSIWDAAGGPASIGSLGTSLVVSADLQTHEQIDALLELFRKRWGTLRTVSVRAYWLRLADDQLAALLVEGEAARAKTGELPAFGIVDSQAWRKHIQQLAADAKSPAGYRAALTCYNGQTVYTISGRQSLAVTGIEPVLVKGDQGLPQGRVAYRPMTSVLHEGASLQVTPIASITGKFVVIDVHSRVVEICPPPAQEKEARPAVWMGGAGMVPDEMPGADAPHPADVVAVLDRPRLVAQRFSTTLRVPVDQPMLVGGMTFEGGELAGQSNLYLFLTVSVQELRDDVPDGKVIEPKPGTVVPREDRPATKPRAKTPPAAKPEAKL